MEGHLVVLLVICSCMGRVLPQSTRTWSISVGDDFGVHDYRDKGGNLAGFGVDLIDLVCQEGRMDCRVVWMPYSSCWNSGGGEHPSGGVAIHSRWVDACSGWFTTVERIHSVQFTKPWTKVVTSSFFVRKGEAGRFNYNNLNGKKIAFLKGWASNEQCVARNLAPLAVDQMRHYEFVSQAVDALVARVVDAIFMNTISELDEEKDKMERYPRTLTCTLAGAGMLSRKDSSFTSNFNVAFGKLLNTPKFGKFCEATNNKHGATGSQMIDCVE